MWQGTALFQLCIILVFVSVRSVLQDILSDASLGSSIPVDFLCHSSRGTYNPESSALAGKWLPGRMSSNTLLKNTCFPINPETPDGRIIWFFKPARIWGEIPKFWNGFWENYFVKAFGELPASHRDSFANINRLSFPKDVQHVFHIFGKQSTDFCAYKPWVSKLLPAGAFSFVIITFLDISIIGHCSNSN